MITSTKVKLIESIDFQNSTFPELHIIADHLRNCSGPIQGRYIDLHIHAV